MTTAMTGPSLAPPEIGSGMAKSDSNMSRSVEIVEVAGLLVTFLIPLVAIYYFPFPPKTTIMILTIPSSSLSSFLSSFLLVLIIAVSPNNPLP